MEREINSDLGDSDKICNNGEPVYDINDLVSRITPENKHSYADTDFGEPVGKEKL